ncbi:uncharacterized protein AB9W97_019404 isoform 2-T2 [Spinachia spinachia]
MHHFNNTAVVKPFEKKMKKMRTLTRFVKPGRPDSMRRLIEKNQQDEVIRDGLELPQNLANDHEQRRQQTGGRITCEEAATLLGVAPEALASEAGAPPSVVGLVQVFLDRRFPEIPDDVEQNLRGHLSGVQETVLRELVRLAPQLHSEGLLECCHLQTFKHLDDLLRIVSRPTELLRLLNWVPHTYLSRDLLGHPDLQWTDPIKKVDHLLLTQWTSRAEEKLFNVLMTHVGRSLERILQIETSYDDLHVDTIQCIDAVLKISPRLSEKLQEACMGELLRFLKKYTAAQKDLLRKKANMDKPETKDFFRNLNNCKKLTQYVQEKDKEGLLVEIIKDMEAFTLKLFRESVADVAERRLQKYFKSQNKEFSLLLDNVGSLLAGLPHYEDVQMTVMDEAYKLLAHIYLKRLVATRLSCLRTRWWADVGRRVTEDAEILHHFLSQLVRSPLCSSRPQIHPQLNVCVCVCVCVCARARVCACVCQVPGVTGWNAMLLKVQDLLRSPTLVATKRGPAAPARPAAVEGSLRVPDQGGAICVDGPTRLSTRARACFLVLLFPLVAMLLNPRLSTGGGGAALFAVGTGWERCVLIGLPVGCNCSNRSDA